jgi:hypothetical protein
MAFFPFHAPRARAALVLALGLLGSQQGCNSSADEDIALAQLAQSCLVNTDCKTPLVCAFESCHAECESSRDCTDGARCVAAARPYKVCQLEEERLCGSTVDCPDGLVCGIDGQCRDQCENDKQCVEEQVCVAGTCADRNELDADGQLTPAPGASFGQEGAPCVYVSDCSAALLCRNQACLAECKADKDCGLGKVCQEARCVADGSAPEACAYSSDCATESGLRCLGGACRCMCAEDRDCPGAEKCDGCACVPDPDATPACDYNSDCENSGEICKDRRCACACQSHVDCSEGEQCDGCGCVPSDAPIDGVVRGTVSVESSLDLSRFRGVVEIQGDLLISGIALADLGHTFDDLRYVDGVLRVQGTKLAHVVFPALEAASGFVLDGTGLLETVEAPLLTNANLNLNGLPSLKELSLPAFESGYVLLYQVMALKELRLPSLRELTELHVNDSPGVERLDFPELLTIRGQFRYQSPQAASALVAISAPKLAEVGGSPSAGAFAIADSKLTSLADIGAADWKMQAWSLQLGNNALLSQCLVDAFAERCKAGGFTGSVSSYSNLACP